MHADNSVGFIGKNQGHKNKFKKGDYNYVGVNRFPWLLLITSMRTAA